MINQHFLLAFILVLVSCGTSFSQAKPGTNELKRPLGLNEAIKRSLENNKQIEIARDSVRIAESELNQLKKRGGSTHGVEIAKLRIDIADARFRQVTIEQITKVQNAYWDLQHGIRVLSANQAGLNEARELLRNTEADIARARADPVVRERVQVQLSNLELAYVGAKETIIQSENLLKYLILLNKEDPLWDVSFVPTDDGRYGLDNSVPLPEALKAALENRVELQIIRIEEKINGLEQKFNKGEKTALAKSVLEAEQLKVRREDLELRIQVEVRNQSQKLQNASQRVLAARNARINAEMLNETEQRKFSTGESETSRILEMQNVLLNARLIELRAEMELTKAFVDLQQITATTLRASR
jgi:outer membrane protein TolC